MVGDFDRKNGSGEGTIKGTAVGCRVGIFEGVSSVGVSDGEILGAGV